MIKRDRHAKFFAFIHPFIFILAAIFFSRAAWHPDEVNQQPIKETIVTSSDFKDATNYFIDDSTGFKTTPKFKHCLEKRARTIGILKESKYGDEAGDVLDSIFDEINTAFKFVNKDGFKSQTFTSEDSLLDHIYSKDYPTEELCFTIGWGTYVNDPEKDAYDFDLEIIMAPK